MDPHEYSECPQTRGHHRRALAALNRTVRNDHKGRIPGQQNAGQRGLQD